MIYLDYSGTTQVSVQHDKLSGASYMWKLIDKDNNSATTFYTADLAGSSYFITSNITISGLTNLTGGTINVKTGQYKYEIYENGTLVKNGLCTINDGTYQPVQKETTTEINTSFSVDHSKNRI